MPPKRKKANIQVSKPELPPFLQRMREQMVANEDSERRERAERLRKSRPLRPDDPDDDPAIIKINDEDLTEEEYENLKKKIDFANQSASDKQVTKNSTPDLDVDELIRSRQDGSQMRKSLSNNLASDGLLKKGNTSKMNNKSLSYSSEED